MNKSEKLFIDWCIKHEFEYSELDLSNTKSPDFKITKLDFICYAEVKEIIANEEEQKVLQQLKERGWSDAYGEEPGKTVREKIKSSYPQIKQYAEPNKTPAILVLYNNTGMIGLGRIDAYNILIGMFGLQTVPIYVPEKTESPPIFGKDYFGSKKSVGSDRNTYLSAILVLFETNEDFLHSIVYHNPFAKYKIQPEYLNLSNNIQFNVNFEKLEWEVIK